MKMKKYLLNDFFDISTTKSVDKNKIKDENDKFWLELSSEDNIPSKIIIEKGEWHCDL